MGLFLPTEWTWGTLFGHLVKSRKRVCSDRMSLLCLQRRWMACAIKASWHWLNTPENAILAVKKDLYSITWLYGRCLMQGCAWQRKHTRTVSSICSTLSCSQESRPSMMTASRVWFWVKPSMVLAILAMSSTSHFKTWEEKNTDQLYEETCCKKQKL